MIATSPLLNFDDFSLLLCLTANDRKYFGLSFELLLNTSEAQISNILHQIQGILRVEHSTTPIHYSFQTHKVLQPKKYFPTFASFLSIFIKKEKIDFSKKCN